MLSAKVYPWVSMRYATSTLQDLTSLCFWEIPLTGYSKVLAALRRPKSLYAYKYPDYSVDSVVSPLSYFNW